MSSNRGVVSNKIYIIIFGWTFKKRTSFLELQKQTNNYTILLWNVLLEQKCYMSEHFTPMVLVPN